MTQVQRLIGVRRGVFYNYPMFIGWLMAQLFIRIRSCKKI